MKKILALILIAAMVLALCSCGSKKQEQPVEQGESFEELIARMDENGRFIEGKAEVTITAGQESIFRNNTYDDTVRVIVSGSSDDTAIARFINCEFKNGLVLVADEKAIAILESDCLVSGGKLSVESQVREAKDDADLPKIISLVPAEFEAENAAGFMIYDSEVLMLNDKEFKRIYAEYSYSEETGYITRTGTDWNLFYVAQWWEDGNWKTFTCVQNI
jgi:hypothetical protein